MSDATDKYGRHFTEGARVYFPGGQRPGRVTAIDTYRPQPVQVQTGWMHQGSAHTATYRWYGCGQLVLSVPAR